MVCVATTLFVFAAACHHAAKAFVLPSSSSSFFLVSRKIGGWNDQESSSSSSTKIESTYVGEPQTRTFSKTNFDFTDPQSQTSSLVKSRHARDFKSSKQQEQQESFLHPSAVTVHGGVLRTWSFDYNVAAEVANVHIHSEGSPVDATVELWEGPNYAPVYLRTYSQDGSTHPLSMKLLLDDTRSHSLAIRNTGPNTFPMQAAVTRSHIDTNLQYMLDRIGDNYEDNLQGGASLSYPIDSTVERTQLLLRTEGRPLNVRVELMQGPSNNKMITEIQSMDGTPLLLSIETPGYANVIRVINLSPLEFPIISFVDPSHLDHRGGTEDLRHYFAGGNYNQYRDWGNSRHYTTRNNRRERRETDGYTNGYGGSETDRYKASTVRDLGFKSKSMNKSSDRYLAAEVNRNYAAPVQQEPYRTKNNINPNPVETSTKLSNNDVSHLNIRNNESSTSNKPSENANPDISNLNSSNSYINNLNNNGKTNTMNSNVVQEGGRFGSVLDRTRYGKSSHSDLQSYASNNGTNHDLRRHTSSPSSSSSGTAWYENTGTTSSNGGWSSW